MAHNSPIVAYDVTSARPERNRRLDAAPLRGYVSGMNTATGARQARIPALDLARSGALLAMIIYHFAYDLELFGYLAQGTALAQPLRGLAVATASSFLFLAGVSLVLAHGQGIRWRGFLRRLAMLAAAALLISLATALALPMYLTVQYGIPLTMPAPSYIYFGILHCIATLSLLGLLLLRLPWPVLAVLAVTCFALPDLLELQPRWLLWTGLVEPVRPALDFVPLFPWAAAFLAGMTIGQLGRTTGFWSRLSNQRETRRTARLAWPGKHSLAIYLIHQPVLIAAIWGVSQIIR